MCERTEHREESPSCTWLVWRGPQQVEVEQVQAQPPPQLLRKPLQQPGISLLTSLAQLAPWRQRNMNIDTDNDTKGRLYCDGAK